MQVQSVNNISFKAIYKDSDAYYNENQQKVADKIQTALRTPDKRFNNDTAENYYKNLGVDFLLSPYCYDADAITYKDCISVFGYKGVKNVGTGINQAITYTDTFSIGVYNEDAPFNIDDINIGLKEKQKTNISTVFLMLLPILAFTGALLFNRSCNNVKTKTGSFNNAIEKFDNSIQQNKIDMSNIVGVFDKFKK